MNANLRHWNALARTNPAHTKPFQRAGGFRGTAIRPIYTVEKMTEHFGPCGVGWGMDKPEFTTMPAADELLVYCTVALWYVDGDKRGTVYGVGGDKVVTKGKDGLRTSDEAFKAAYTDALSNAMKQIGMSADVHMGLFEDSKYKRDLEREFAEEPPAPRAAAQNADTPADTLKVIAEQIAKRLKAAPDAFRLDTVMDDARPEIAKLPRVTQEYLQKLYADRHEAMTVPA